MRYLSQAPVNIGTVFGAPSFSSTNSVSGLVSLIVKLGFVISGLLVLFFLIFAGFNIVAGAGSNNPEAAKKGQQAATAAAAGFAVVFVAYWIVRIIELITGAHLIT